MTKEEVLQKANDYCNEKSYTEETLTSEFKSKFSEFFAKRYADKEIDDDITAEIKFNLDTAFSATSKGLTAKQKAFETKESEYQRQIDELKKKTSTNNPPEPPKFEIPKEILEQLDELKNFKRESKMSEIKKEVIKIGKKSVREDLHKSFERFADDIQVSLDESSEKQAEKLVERFQDIFRDSLGSIKPLTPKQKEKLDEDFFSGLKKVKVQQ